MGIIVIPLKISPAKIYRTQRINSMVVQALIGQKNSFPRGQRMLTPVPWDGEDTPGHHPI